MNDPPENDESSPLRLHGHGGVVPSPADMHSPARRRLIKGLAAPAPPPLGPRRSHRFAVAELDPALLRALGAAVLPSELGDGGVTRTVAGFERWLAGYREGAELLHGYGTGGVRRTGPSPALRWARQLRGGGQGR